MNYTTSNDGGGGGGGGLPASSVPYIAHQLNHQQYLLQQQQLLQQQLQQSSTLPVPPFVNMPSQQYSDSTSSQIDHSGGSINHPDSNHTNNQSTPAVHSLEANNANFAVPTATA